MLVPLNEPSNFRYIHINPATNRVHLLVPFIAGMDGGQHTEQLDYDSQRTKYLGHFGFKILRFWNSDIFLQFDAVLEQLRQCIEI